MAVNRVFFPQEALDNWLADDEVDLDGDVVVMKDESQKYRISEGVRVIRELTGEGDPYELVGRCKSLVFLRELGADIVETSMIIEDYAYDIIPGFLGIPLSAQNQPNDSTAPRDSMMSDEELLAEFLARTM